MSGDIIWCKLGDFNQNKNADQTYFVGTLKCGFCKKSFIMNAPLVS